MKKNYFKSLAQVAMLLCVPLFIASCDDFGTEDNPIPSYISMKTDAVTITLKKGVDPTFTRTAMGVSDAVIEYSSEFDSVATVDPKTGVVTAVSEGNTRIFAKATGYSTGGKKIFEEATMEYPVTVKDYRARIALKNAEKSTIIVNQADNGAEYPVDLKELLEVTPAIGTDGLTITFTPATTGDDIFNSLTAGNIILKDAVGTKKITAKLTAGNLPEGYEQASFPEEQEVEFTVTVKEGIAYLDWDATEGKTVRKTIFKKDDADKDQYTVLDNTWLLAQTADVTLEKGTYFITANSTTSSWNIKLKGDVNFIISDGVVTGTIAGPTTASWIKSIQTDVANSHKLNIYGQEKGSGTIFVKNTEGDAIMDLNEINVYGGEIIAEASGASGGGINQVNSINVYNGYLIGAMQDNPGYGIKMSDGGLITLAGEKAKLSAYAYGAVAGSSYGIIGDVKINKGFVLIRSSAYKAINGKLTAGTGYKFQECDDLVVTPPATPGDDPTYTGTWEDITGDTSNMKYVMSVKK